VEPPGFCPSIPNGLLGLARGLPLLEGVPSVLRYDRSLDFAKERGLNVHSARVHTVDSRSALVLFAGEHSYWGD
jgi:hypothetical protein